MWPRQFFVAGTDTDVGKTFVSAILQAGLSACYWKPIQCGLSPCTDTEWVMKATALPVEMFIKERFRFAAPLAPRAAAQAERKKVRVADFSLPDTRERPLIVEGAGGVLVPLNETELLIDLMSYLQLPCLVVARSGLGTINHTLLTLEVLRLWRVPVIGVVMNGPRNDSNRHDIENFGDTSVVAQIEPQERLTPALLKILFDKNFQLQNNDRPCLKAVSDVLVNPAVVSSTNQTLV
jgi:dethiobiotin synthetase